MNTFTRILEEDEANHIRIFHGIPQLKGFFELPDAQRKTLLLQRRLFALRGFEPFYNTALTLLSDEEAKQITREIIAEEYPTKYPNHREDIVHDLKHIGISEIDIFTTPYVAETRKSVEDALGTVSLSAQQLAKRDLSDVLLLAALRATEVMAGKEYALIFPTLEKRYGLRKEISRFYWSHLGHDRTEKPMHEGGTSHADRFAKRLGEFVDTAEKLTIAQQTNAAMYGGRKEWYSAMGKKEESVGSS